MLRRYWAFALVGIFSMAATPVFGQPASTYDKEAVKALSKRIDEHLAKAWKKAKVTPATKAEEAIFFRRLNLDLAGRIPDLSHIDDFMANLPGNRKVLVFAHHRDVIEHLKVSLTNWSPAVIIGALGPSERAAAVDRFLYEDRCRMLIGNIAAAGTGLTLVGPHCKCSDVIFVEATYSVSDNYQAACRVHRIGQNDAVVARYLTAHGTIDDRIQSILARKAQDFEQLFN